MSRAADESSAFALPRPSKTLTALTTSALALPGIAGSANADAPIERATAAAAFSYYNEDNLSPGKFFDNGGGSRERYEVFTGQLRFELPVSKRVDVGIDLLYEEMSGASPWFVSPDPDPNGQGQPLQVMSGATIDDTRFDAVVDTNFYLDRGKDTVSFGVSTEKDYLSIHGGIGTERNYNDKNTTLSAAGSFAYDWIDPTDASLFTDRPTSGEKWSIDLFGGLSQIVSRSSTVSFTVNYKHSDGYLADPYKAITLIDGNGGSNIISDKRPDEKDQVSLLARYRHHFEAVTGSLHADYRFYADDWGINSHTVELAWYQNFMEWLTITPSVRWYTQGKADFYDTLLIGNRPSHRSSDYRLSPYGAVSYKLKAEVDFPDVMQYDTPNWLQAVGITDGVDLVASVSYERYYSDGDISLFSVSESEEAPGLVRFRVIAVSLSGRF